MNATAKLRVIQWNTGKVGKHCVRAVLDDPRLELVGAYAYSADKAGQDVGVLSGRPPCGITATSDIDALIALHADTVFYTPFMADLGHVIRLLEAGMDVISTNLFLNVGGIRGEVQAQLEAACARGQASLYITGINPGWMNSMVASMTAICRRVDCITVTESADSSTYESVETWDTLGFGLPEANEKVLQAAYDWMILFRDSVFRMAEALDYQLEDTAFSVEYATASERIDLGWYVMEKDTNCAIRATWAGKIGGKTVIENKIVWYLTKKLNQDWNLDPDQYHIVIKGEPNIETRFRFTPPENWNNHDWDVMTALPAVSGIFNVRDARPGILGLKDVGLICAPVGIWLQNQK
jgi:hypothetical protein